MYIDNEWATIIDKVFTATVTVTPQLYQPVNQALRSHPDSSPNFQFPLSNRFLHLGSRWSVLGPTSLSLQPNRRSTSHINQNTSGLLNTLLTATQTTLGNRYIRSNQRHLAPTMSVLLIE